MAKIKSPLMMADGARVRTMEELREHFDIVSVLAYYDSGKLRGWLENYYYDEEADEIGKLDPLSVDIKEKICGILGVSCPGDETEDIALADVSDKNKRLEKLKKFTGDDELLKAVDYVAFTQEELQNLLDEGAKKIYLCQEQGEFEIPDTEGITYIGVNHPSASIPEWFGEKGIVLQNVDIVIEKILLSAEKCSSDQDYAEAVKLWSKAAALGNVEAQCRLGCCYQLGDGVAEDKGEAYKWYRKAADQGYARAQCNLGGCYYLGEGVEQDYVEACKWYRKAANQGDADAQNNLGLCYELGEGVEQDYVEAYKWYRKAAEQGDVNAQSNLGDCYYFGNGVAKDEGEAYKWYRKAAEQGDAKAQRIVGENYYYGKEYREAYRWCRKAAEQGDAAAQNMVGKCYEEGRGVEQDKMEAYKWYWKAAEQGVVYARIKVEQIL